MPGSKPEKLEMWRQSFKSFFRRCVERERGVPRLTKKQKKKHKEDLAK